MEHADAVGDVLDHRQVVGDEQIGRARLLLDVLHQVDDLRLNRHVQRRDALVGDDELRVHDKGAGNADALTLAAGELVGVALGVFRCKAHLRQNLLYLLAALGLRLVHMVDVQTLADDVLHLLAGVQGCHRVLEDHLHLGAQGVVLGVAQMAADVLPVECDPACGGVIQPDDAPADGGFARAGLAHQTIGLAGIDLKADIVHGLDREVFVHLEILLQPLDLQQRGSALCCHLLRLLDLFCFCAHPGHTFLVRNLNLR